MLSGVELTTGEAVFAGLVLLLASFVRGYSGFGFSAVLVAGLAFIIEPVAAVPLAITFEVAASVVQGRSVWSEIRWRDFWVLLLAAIVGNPIGVLILTNADADGLRAMTFTLLLILSVGLLLSRRPTVDPSLTVVFLVGTIAGVANGATAMSGLVLVLAMSFTTIPTAEMRATLVAYFFASDLLVLGLLAATGDLEQETLVRVAVGLPLMAVGILLGTRAFRQSTEASFRRATLGLLIAISVTGLARLAVG